jgi:hypothetical protein
MRLTERLVSIIGKVLTDQSKVNSCKIVDTLHSYAQKDASIEKCCKSHQIQIGENIASSP